MEIKDSAFTQSELKKQQILFVGDGINERLTNNKNWI